MYHIFINTNSHLWNYFTCLTYFELRNLVVHNRHRWSPSLMLLDIQVNPTTPLNPSNHHHSTTKKHNRSKTHEQSNTFSKKISKINILFENLTRKIERSKRFGFEKDKVLLWMIVIIDLLVFLVEWWWLVKGNDGLDVQWGIDQVMEVFMTREAEGGSR